jgi:hypothetical protein
MRWAINQQVIDHLPSYKTQQTTFLLVVLVRLKWGSNGYKRVDVLEVLLQEDRPVSGTFSYVASRTALSSADELSHGVSFDGMWVCFEAVVNGNVTG